MSNNKNIMRTILVFILTVIFSASNICYAQSALETLKAMGGNARVNVPPVSDPVCCYCGANRSDSPRR